MRRTKSWISAALVSIAVVGALAVAAAAVAPAVGTIGTTVTVTGAGYGAKKGKVTLEGAGKPIALKVTSWSDTEVAAVVKKGALGTFDVVVRPKGAEPVVQADAFAIVLGAVSTISPEAPLPKQEVTITGELFGTKKGSVTVGGKKAKVKSWTDTQIRAVLHKKTPAGAQPLVVRNKVGVAGIEGPVEIGSEGGGTPGPGIFKASATLFRDRVVASGPDEVSGVNKGTGIQVEVDTDYRGTPVKMVFDLSNVDRASAGGKVEPVLFEVKQGSATWRAAPGASSVQLRVRNGVYSADFSGDLALVAGEDSRDPLDVRGSFDVTIAE